MPVTVASGSQRRPVVIPDGTGGGYVTWDDEGTWDIYLQRLTPSGEPAAGWPTGGLLVCAQPGIQGGALMTTDGSGGVIVAWADYRDGPVAQYAQRVLADGSIAPGWPVNGARIVFDRYMRDLVPDGIGGAYLACATGGDDDYFLQRFTSAGTISPGWPEGGAAVCTAPDVRFDLRMVADGFGGALLTWADYRDFWEDEIFLQRMQPDGTLYPGWPVDGLRVTDNVTYDSGPALAADGMGGAYLCWGRLFGDGDRVAVQRVTGGGAAAPGWPPEGRVIPSEMPAGAAQITADGVGGAIVAWEKTDHTVRALRFNLDGPTAVQVSLASVEATPERVVLRWQGAGAGSLGASVERRTATSGWERIGAAEPDGPDALRYQDRSMVAGGRYGYRLSYRESGSERSTSEAWVDVPAAWRLGLRGFQPNPAVGTPVVGLTLAGDGAARLEVLDVAGRRVLTREVGDLGPGRHALRLDDVGSLAPGVYAIRLVQAGMVLTARGVVTR